MTCPHAAHSAGAGGTLNTQLPVSKVVAHEVAGVAQGSPP
jgi:hypothetical protein